MCEDCHEQLVDPIWYKPDLCTVVVEHTEDDPTLLVVHVQGEYAAQWAAYHGSLGAGTWEKPDGPDFVYHVVSWAPGLIEQITADGFDLGRQYSEPDRRDLAVAQHAASCDACSGDWHRADPHLNHMGLAPCNGWLASRRTEVPPRPRFARVVAAGRRRRASTPALAHPPSRKPL